MDWVLYNRKAFMSVHTSMGVCSCQLTVVACVGLLCSSATLVVCPKSLMLQWEAEINRRVERGTLRTHVHHGSGRATDPRV